MFPEDVSLRIILVIGWKGGGETRDLSLVRVLRGHFACHLLIVYIFACLLIVSCCLFLFFLFCFFSHRLRTSP